MSHPAQGAYLSVILGSVSDKAYGLGPACLLLCGSATLNLCDCRTSDGISTPVMGGCEVPRPSCAHLHLSMTAAPKLPSVATTCTRGCPMILASLGRRAQDGSKHLEKRMSQPSQGCIASELSLTVGITRGRHPCRVCRLDRRAPGGAATC
jgi:hypothetical protein